MNLCIDQGNSNIKIAVFDGDKIVFSTHFTEFDPERARAIIQQYKIKSAILSSVTDISGELSGFLERNVERFIILTHETPVPIINRYKTPELLGKDRLAAVIGAAGLMPQTDLLVIDAGTAITYDFIDASTVYHGEIS